MFVAQCLWTGQRSSVSKREDFAVRTDPVLPAQAGIQGCGLMMSGLFFSRECLDAGTVKKFINNLIPDLAAIGMCHQRATVAVGMDDMLNFAEAFHLAF